MASVASINLADDGAPMRQRTPFPNTQYLWGELHFPSQFLGFAAYYSFVPTLLCRA
jgi:hypothetical protein